MKDWNSLLDYVVDSFSINSFKALLDSDFKIHFLNNYTYVCVYVCFNQVYRQCLYLY